MFVFRFPFVFLQKIRDAPPLTHYNESKRLYRGPPKYLDKYFLKIEVPVLLHEYTEYIFNSYLPTKGGFCIAGSSEAALELDIVFLLDRQTRDFFCQGCREPSNNFNTFQFFLIIWENILKYQRIDLRIGLYIM